ncbi:MAG: hypothetical protein SF182_22335 [Deltaproteobacteria bacterium]|nr:hypothetical protein [Deltaproteobacteria bacterium]
MRSWLIALGPALLLATGLTLLNRGLTLAAPLRWPIELAGFAFAAGVVFWLRGGTADAPPSRGVRAALLAVGTVTLAWLLYEGTVALNHRTGNAEAETVTAVVTDLIPAGRWIAPADCAVVLEPWRAGAEPVALPLGGAIVRDASGAIAACRTPEGSAVQRGERVALRTRIGGLGLEYLTADAGHALLVPPCNTCGKH